MITLGRRGDLHARRQATAFLRSRDVVHRLFADVAPRFKDRPGGYSRIVRLGPRPGDAAEMAYLELVDDEYVEAQREERAQAEAAPAAADEEVLDAGADEGADDGDDATGDADEPEALDEAGLEEAPADPRKPD